MVKRVMMEIGQFVERLQQNELFHRVKTPPLVRIVDRISFVQIFLVWVIVVVLFGLMYHFFASDRSYLFYTIAREPVQELANAIYFSFVTSTSTGFGDIVPYGLFRAIAIIEVLSGLILIAVITSKIISLKQDVVLDELYELSFTEKINRLRSSLLLFRQNISRLVSKVEDGSVRKREVRDMYVYLASLEDMLVEIKVLLHRPRDKEFTKHIDPVSAELIFVSVVHSFEKVQELVHSLEEHKIEWSRDITKEFIGKCVRLNSELFLILEKMNMLEKTVDDLSARNKIAVSELQKWV